MIDLVNALLILHAFAGRHADLFAAIGVDHVRRRRVAEVARAIERMVAENAQRHRRVSAKDLRDRFFTAAARRAAEVRAFAAFAFRDDPRTLDQFASAYLRRRNAKRKKSGGHEPAAPTDHRVLAQQR